jgi:hypothetical protein
LPGGIEHHPEVTGHLVGADAASEKIVAALGMSESLGCIANVRLRRRKIWDRRLAAAAAPVLKPLFHCSAKTWRREADTQRCDRWAGGTNGLVRMTPFAPDEEPK